MSQLLKARMHWNGASGGQGTSTLHIARSDLTNPTATDVHNAHLRWRLLMENTSEWLPNDVTVSWPPAQDVIDSATGDLVGTATDASPPSPVPGALTTAWQNGVGTRIVWNTGVVSGGRRVKGFTYLVPYGGIFDTDGTLSAAATTDITGAAAAFREGLVTDNLTLVVYRETLHTFFSVVSSGVTDKAVILRSRRD